ncbi:MAG: glycosyltransferase family 4 protein [Pseudomonadota bacterium]
MTRCARVALFYDVNDWAFHNVARNVAHVIDGFAFSLYGRNDWFGRKSVVQRIALEADVMVFLWRFDILAFLDCLDGKTWRRFAGPDRPALVTIVYDHLYQDSQALEKMGNPFAVSDLVCVSSQRLRRAYEASYDLPDIFCTLPDGVDLSRFAPSDEAPAGHRPLRLGWVGNSRWANTEAPDLKGRRTIFDAAIAVLRARGRAVEVHIADAGEARIPSAQMPDFYRQIDVLVCTSAMEGTPNPVLEAMASGAAIVTTDVGIVPEVLGPRQSEFIVRDRSARAFADALDRLLSDRDLCTALRQENLGRRHQLSWTTRAPLWKGMLYAAQQVRFNHHRQSCREALNRYRWRPRSGIERARRLVAMNPLAFRAYETLRQRAPGIVRQTKRLLERGSR